MGKTQKLNPDEKVYEEKYKNISVNFLKVNGVKYLKMKALKPIGNCERKPTAPLIGVEGLSNYNFKIPAHAAVNLEESSTDPEDVYDPEIIKKPQMVRIVHLNLYTFLEYNK